jgi:hypothetical protein
MRGRNERRVFTSASYILDFVRRPSLEPMLGMVAPTFTRASAATRFNAAGVLETVANNGPRFDYHPATPSRVWA